jgi:hypothetical protein
MSGKKIVLATGASELRLPFAVWVDGKKKKDFISTEEVATYLIKEQGISPELARQKTGEMRPGHKVLIDADGKSSKPKIFDP